MSRKMIFFSFSRTRVFNAQIPAAILSHPLLPISPLPLRLLPRRDAQSLGAPISINEELNFDDFSALAFAPKLRNTADTFFRMKEYGFLPNVKSCNACLSSMLELGRADVALSFYREMRRSRISPNEYTINMVISALCKLGKLDKAVEMLGQMEGMGCSPSVASYNILIAGHCSKGLLSSAMKLKSGDEQKCSAV